MYPTRSRHNLNDLALFVTTETQQMSLSIWEKETRKTLRALTYATINNGFEEAMKLTEEGKLWAYPVDNEQGMRIISCLARCQLGSTSYSNSLELQVLWRAKS